MMAVFCLFFWPDQLVCSQGMPAGMGGGVTGMSWGRKAGGRRSSDRLGTGTQERESAAGFQLQSWG